MSDVFVVAPLAGADAMAVRCGDDVLVHMAPDVPQWAHALVADDLRRAVRLADGRDAVVTLPAGQAALVALDAQRPLPRRVWSAPKVAAAAAMFALPLGGLVFVTSDVAPAGSSTVAAPVISAWPAKPAPHPSRLQVAAPVAQSPARQVAPVSIHPPTTFKRAAPQSFGEADVTPAGPQTASTPAPSLSVPVACPAPPQLLSGPSQARKADPQPAPKTEAEPEPAPAPDQATEPPADAQTEPGQQPEPLKTT